MNDPKRIVDDRIIMLLYRLAMDHEGIAPISEVNSFGVWAEPSMNAATASGWLRQEPSTDTVEITPEGRKALRRELSLGRTVVFGGSVPDEGPVVRIIVQKPKYVWRLQEGLTPEDYKPVLDAEEYESVYDPIELGFPGLMHHHTPFWWGPDRDHPLAGRTIDPRGYPGKYLVTATLRRQGAPDNPKTIQMDQQFLEGDSHLRLPEGFRGERDAAGQPQFMLIQEVSEDGELIEFVLVPNRWGRLGKIQTEVEAKSFGDANNKVYKNLLPVLCDLSYRYDVPLDILQINAVERTTLTHAVQKVHDYPEAVLPEDPFDGGINYANFPLYSTLVYLYREGLNSSSFAYGFLCFYKVIEGIRKMREKKAAEGERRRYENEKVEGQMTKHFDEEFHGKRFGYVMEKMTPMRDKLAHAFLDTEGPEIEEFDSLDKRIELETELSRLRSQAREIVKVMMHNEYWATQSSLDQG